nr:MAG TPA: hypothetical protein [Caudoviricetes sp.]
MTTNDDDIQDFQKSKKAVPRKEVCKWSSFIVIPPGKREKTQAQMTGGGDHFSPKGQKRF